MGRVRVNISADGLTASASAQSGSPSATNEVLSALTAAGVVHGVETDAVNELGERLVDAAYAGSRVVARGTAAEHGIDGRIEDLDPGAPVAGVQRHDGSVDFRERQFLRTFAVDEQLARVFAPTPGTDGRDVRDRVIKAKPGKPHKVRLGDGVRVDGEHIVAARAGSLLRDERRIDIVPLYTHAADVDYHSGNLHMEGSLAVRGDVHEGFAATATGDVHVTGAVLGAAVRGGGSIRIDQGVLGLDAQVHAGGDVLCRHATSALLQAGGGVVIGDQATHCRIHGASLTAKSGRGAIVGGEARIAKFIKVRVAGTPNGALTQLVVADPDACDPEPAPAPTAAAKEPARRTTTPSSAAAPTAVAIDPAVRLRRRERMRELMKIAVIEVTDVLYAGVRVTIGDVSLVIDQSKQHVRLRYAEATNTIAEEPLA